MPNVCDKSLDLLRADDGGVAIEYALLSALIAGVIVFSVAAFGSSLTGTFSQIAAALDATQPGAGGPGGHGWGQGGNGNGNNGNGKGNGGPKVG